MKKSTLKRLALLITVGVLAQTALAGEFNGVTLPDQDLVMGKKLFLNGMALREKTILGMDFNVYVGGLYVEKKSADGPEIINSKGIKIFRMRFLYTVFPALAKDTWNEDRDRVCKGAELKKDTSVVKDCEDSKKSFEDFKALFSTVKAGQSAEYVISPGLVVIRSEGKDVGKISGEAFSRFILQPLIGNYPVSAAIHDRLLGTLK